MAEQEREEVYLLLWAKKKLTLVYFQHVQQYNTFSSEPATSTGIYDTTGKHIIQLNIADIV